MLTILENIEELRKIKNLTEEDIEFLKAIQEQAEQLLSDLEKKEDDITELKETELFNSGKIIELEKCVKKLEEEELKEWIKTGIGYIAWGTDNLQLQQLMERLEEKLITTPPNKILA